MSVFRGPTVEESPAGGDSGLMSLFWRYRLQRGVTVVKDANGVWKTVRYVQDSYLNSCQEVYRGGYEYPLTSAQVTELTAAGYGAYIF